MLYITVYFVHYNYILPWLNLFFFSDVLNTVNATCRIVYRLITNDMLVNSVTLRLDDITATSFMTSMYGYTVQALAEVLRLLPSQIYIIDIKVLSL